MNRKTVRSNSRAVRRGFTLIEIIVVVIIIGVLATLIAPRVLDRIGHAKTAVAETNARSLRTQIDLFTADHRPLRSGDTIRGILWEKPSDVSDSWKPYINNEDDLLDPWGNPYILVVPGDENLDYDIVSYGADGKAGGDGDDTDVIK